jgi:hypothetical protein
VSEASSGDTTPVIGKVTPEPTAEELAAIVAAIELAWPRPAAGSEEPASQVWRFSGRWWREPVVARRERPAASWNPFRSTDS